MRTLLTEGTEAAASLPMSPLAFAGVAAGIFTVLLLVTYAFLNVSHRH